MRGPLVVKQRLWRRLGLGCVLALAGLAGLTRAATPGAAPAACPPVAEAPTPEAMPQLARQARDRGLLWRVEQGGRTSWLYGTLHEAERGWVMPGPTVMQALRSADRLALELNVLDPAVLAALQSALQSRADAPPLPADLAHRLAAQVKAACLDDDTARLRPDAQVLTLVTLAGRSEGLDPAYGIDLWLAALSSSLGKPVLALETPERQIRELVSDDPAQVASTVRNGLDQLERGDAGQQLATLAHAWADGRLQLLETYPAWCDCMQTPAERADYDRLVAGRNPGMAAALVAEHRSGRSVFAAVGALHMVGPQGLPALLAAQGFRVERVHFPPARPANGTRQEFKSKGPPAQ